MRGIEVHMMHLKSQKCNWFPVHFIYEVCRTIIVDYCYEFDIDDI